MIIIYDKANTLTLSYNTEKGNVKYVKFVPGRNDVDSEIWNAIVKTNEKRFEHYGKFLYALDEEAAGDNGIDYGALSPKKLSELIENSMDIDKLAEIEAAEKGREKGPRTAVLKEIEKQLKAFADLDKKIADEKKKEDN